MKQKPKSITEKVYGGLRDTLLELRDSGVITEQELSCVMVDLILSTAGDMMEQYLLRRT